MPNIAVKFETPDITENEIVQRVESGEDIRLLDLNIVRDNYRNLKEAFPYATTYAAVKANTSEGILEVLNQEGSNFEVATIEELNECTSRQIKPEKVIFTHPAKDAVEISKAHAAGVDRFTSDSEEDLSLIAKYAPGSKVMIRMKTANEDKEHDTLTGFNSRFGVSDENVKSLLIKSKEMGLEPYGIAFHVGTQQEDINAWDSTIKKAAKIFKDMKEDGIELEVLDIGGGFPSRYKDSIPLPEKYGEAIGRSINEHFEKCPPKEVIYEPGRSISAMAGVTLGRVINVKSEKSKDIVTLSTGRFNAGLFNVGNGMTFYRKNTEGSIEKIPDKIAKKADIYGKACASFDQPVEGSEVHVPAGLKSGDLVSFTGTGAYSGEMTTNWCSKAPPTTITFDSSRKRKNESWEEYIKPQEQFLTK